jgi:hypothetical protein
MGLSCPQAADRAKGSFSVRGFRARASRFGKSNMNMMPVRGGSPAGKFAFSFKGCASTRQASGKTLRLFAQRNASVCPA